MVAVKEYCIKGPKNETSGRQVAAPKYVFDMLKKYYTLKEIAKNGAEDERVYDYCQPQSYSSRFSDLVKKFDMPKIRFHDLRHFNAVIMMMYGVPDKVAAERLGHSNTQMLHSVYQHVLKDIDRAAANKINVLFKG